MPMTKSETGEARELSIVDQFHKKYSISEKSDEQPGFTAKEVKKLNETVRHLKDMLKMQKTETLAF